MTDLEKITERLRTCSDRWTLSVVAAEVERMMRDCAARAWDRGWSAGDEERELPPDWPLLP